MVSRRSMAVYRWRISWEHLRIGDQLLSRRRQSFQQNLRLRPVWMYIPHQVHRNIGVNEDQIDSPVQSHAASRSEEHTSELQSLRHLVCRLLLEKKKNTH